MRKFRRKPRVVWLPVVGNDVAGVSEENHSVLGPSGTIIVPGDGELVFDQAPVTFDYSDPPSFEMGSFERSLQDLTSGNSYRLRRLVGKIHVGVTPQSNVDDVFSNIEVAAGFIVNKTDDSGNPLTTFTSGLETNPLSQDSAQDPWIWRRKWILHPVYSGYTSNTLQNVVDVHYGQPKFPQTNAGYGSVQDGPHIDQKTARIIGNQERLFFWLSARTVQDNASIDPAILWWWLDLRILASLRTNQGNRRNASR